jgi:hypothetical protein
MAQIFRLSRLPEDPDEMIDQLLHPAQFYAHPADVAADELLTIGERRAYQPYAGRRLRARRSLLTKRPPVDVRSLRCCGPSLPSL